MSMRPLKRVSPTTRHRAIAHRQNPTKPEQLLWSILSGRKLGGLKFRRQHPIEPYIVDFYCADAKLIVELDGESHNGRED
jgi:very-short-patch-repair endonuclease